MVQWLYAIAGRNDSHLAIVIVNIQVLELIVVMIIVIAVAIIVALFLNTRLGLSIRATGDNPDIDF